LLLFLVDGQPERLLAEQTHSSLFDGGKMKKVLEYSNDKLYVYCYTDFEFSTARRMFIEHHYQVSLMKTWVRWLEFPLSKKDASLFLLIKKERVV
jgi:hypothetical protein